MKPTLDELCIKYGCDKATIHQHAHGYAPFYDQAFESIRLNPIKMLEIGVGSGPSIEAWLEYFPFAFVYGIDHVHSTNKWNTVGAKTDPRYVFITGDQTDTTFWKCFEVDYGNDWDVIIDDGGHFNDQIITTFNGLWPLLNSGGLYCIEDLGVCYGTSTIFVKPGFPNHIDWIRGKIDQLNCSNDIHSIHLSKELAIIKKA
jgi:hypothetical protein